MGVDLLLREYHEARFYIEDIKDICDDFEGLYQRNLAANAGMDFNDLFVFMTRFAIANLVLLHQLIDDEDSINCSLSQMAHHLVFNLKSIQLISSKMKDAATWDNLGGVVINLWETIEDQMFMEFCNSLRRNYGMMFDHSEMNFDTNQSLLEHTNFYLFDLCRSCISNPEDLVMFVDSALKQVRLSSD